MEIDTRKRKTPMENFKWFLDFISQDVTHFWSFVLVLVIVCSALHGLVTVNIGK